MTSDPNDPLAAPLGLTLDNVVTEGHQLLSVTPQNTIQAAVTHLRLNGYSQLPVVEHGRLVGIVSFESIVRAGNISWDQPVHKAMAACVGVHRTTPLLNVIDRIGEDGFVVVVEDATTAVAIVSASDIARIYHEQSAPFLLIGELDRLLRSVMEGAFGFEELVPVLAKIPNRTYASFEDLDFGAYCIIVGSKVLFPRLGWPVERRLLIERLEELRRIRNDIMHFNTEPLDADRMRQLRSLIELLNDLRRAGPLS